MEKRFQITEVRAVKNGDKRTITGYAARYNVLRGDLGGFRERIAAGCAYRKPHSAVFTKVTLLHCAQNLPQYQFARDRFWDMLPELAPHYASGFPAFPPMIAVYVLWHQSTKAQHAAQRIALLASAVLLSAEIAFVFLYGAKLLKANWLP